MDGYTELFFLNHLFVQINAVAVQCTYILYTAKSYFNSDKKKADDTDSPIWALLLKHEKVDRKKELSTQRSVRRFDVITN